MKNIYIVLIMLLICVPVGGLKVEAATQMDSFFTIASNDGSNNNNGKYNDTRLFTRAWAGVVRTDVIKTLDFILPDGRTAPNSSTLDIGQDIRLNRNDTSASWFKFGDFNDSPPSDGQYYSLGRSTKNNDYTIHIGEASPKDKSQPLIESQNPSVLSCDGSTKCTAVNPGTTLVKVTFPRTTYSWFGTIFLNRPRIVNGQDRGFGFINIFTHTIENNKKIVSSDIVARPYSFEPMYFTVTVNPRPNIAGYASCLPNTNMSTTGGTFNWGYNDPEGDAQTNYHFQLSSSSEFNDRDIKYQAAYSWNQNNSYGSMNQQGGSVNIPEGILLPDTTYHTRIAYYNSINGWGNGFMGCGPSFKTLPAPPPQPIPKPIGAVGSCIDKSQTGNITWTNAAGYNTAYMRVIDKTLYPNLTNEQLSNRGEYTKQWNENFVGNSYNFTTIPGHKYDWWMHTKDTNIADTTYQNYSEHVYGEFTCPIPDGICNNNAKNVCISPTSATSITETNTEYKWSCPGFSPSDKTDSCSLLKTPPECTTEPCPPPQPPVCTGPSCSGGGDEISIASTSIRITKIPSVTLNKNGSCKLDWKIVNLPATASCLLKGFGVIGANNTIGTKTLNTTNEDTGSETIANLQSNQRYTITCSGGTLTPAISESVICRVNPDIKEN